MIPKLIITLINMVCFQSYLSPGRSTFLTDLENLGALSGFVLWSMEFTVLTAKAVEWRQPLVLGKLSRETSIIKHRLL